MISTHAFDGIFDEHESQGSLDSDPYHMEELEALQFPPTEKFNKPLEVKDMDTGDLVCAVFVEAHDTLDHFKQTIQISSHLPVQEQALRDPNTGKIVLDRMDLLICNLQPGFVNLHPRRIEVRSALSGNPLCTIPLANIRSIGGLRKLISEQGEVPIDQQKLFCPGSLDSLTTMADLFQCENSLGYIELVRTHCANTANTQETLNHSDIQDGGRQIETGR